MRSSADGLISKNPSWHHDPHRRIAAFHLTHLNRGGVGSQEHIRISIDKECVLHVSSRVLLWEVQPTEYVPIVLDFWALSHHKSHPLQDPNNFASNDTQRMMRSQWNAAVWPGPIVQNFIARLTSFVSLCTFCNEAFSRIL